MKGKTLKKIIQLDESKIADDDHLNKPDISPDEMKTAVDELSEKFKDPVNNNKKTESQFTSSTVDALNKQK